MQQHIKPTAVNKFIPVFCSCQKAFWRMQKVTN